MRREPVAGIAELTAARYRDSAIASAGVAEPPRAPLADGAAGVAYFLLRHASFGGGQESIDAASAWAARAERELDHVHAFSASEELPTAALNRSMHHGEPGVWWIRALVAGAAGDEAALQRSATRFADAATVGAPWDVNWGAAGLLLGCAQLVESLDDPVAVAPVLEAGERLAVELAAVAGRDTVTTEETVLPYLGAAHGWSGVAQALLRWSRATGQAAQPETLALLERLIGLRRRSGRWPVRPGSRTVYRGWCHGSAGWAQLWTLTREMTGEELLLGFAERCADDGVEDEDDNASLCCGRAGQGFAALTLYRATGERRWLIAAQRVAASAARAVVDGVAPAHSLFGGELGVALLAMELEDPARSAMPVYETFR